MIRRVLIALVVVFCGLSLPAWAGEGYVGASYLSTDAEFETVLDSFSTDSGGWKIFGGYDVIKFFGVEVTYYDLGSFSEDSFEADIQVFDLSGRGILPLGERVQLWAKVGYSSVGVDGTFGDATDWELLYGAGIGVKIGEHFGIRGEYEAWDVETSLNSWSLGLYFRF